MLLAIASTCLVSILSAADEPSAVEEGRTLFQQRCSACHTIGGGDRVGPDLAGVASRRERAWLSRFIASPDEVFASNDPVAAGLLKQYGVRMPGLGLSPPEVSQLIAFLEQPAKESPAQPAQAEKVQPELTSNPPLEAHPMGRRVLALFVLATLFIVNAFVSVGRSTLSSNKKFDVKDAYKVRRVMFYSLMALLLIFLAITLRETPYSSGERPEKLVYVTARQFAFATSEGAITSEQDWGRAAGAPAVEIPSGRLVEMRVSSLDVNHGLGIYSAGGQVLAQTQAMPGYVNRLLVRFDKPGKYKLICLEYCGVAHHRMLGELTVH